MYTNVHKLHSQILSKLLPGLEKRGRVSVWREGYVVMPATGSPGSSLAALWGCFCMQLLATDSNSLHE